MTDPVSRIAESDAARAAWDRFVGPALTVLRGDFLKKLAEVGVRPMEGQALAAVQSLSMGLRVADQVEAQLRALIVDGVQAKDDLDRATTLARMSPEERKWANY